MYRFSSTYIIKWIGSFETVLEGISHDNEEKALREYARRSCEPEAFVFECLEAVDIGKDFGDLSQAQAEDHFEAYRLRVAFEGSSDRVEIAGRSYVPFDGEFHHVFAVVGFNLSTLGAPREAKPPDDNYGLPDEDTLMIRDDYVVGVMEPTGEFTHL